MLIRLIGPGGAGKTTTGRALAKELEADFIDIDALTAATLSAAKRSMLIL